MHAFHAGKNPMAIGACDEPVFFVQPILSLTVYVAYCKRMAVPLDKILSRDIEDGFIFLIIPG